MIHLTPSDVRRLLPVRAAIEAARATALTVAAGQVHQAERVWHTPSGMPGQLGIMPSYLPDDGHDPAIFVTKLVGVFPSATPSVNGVLVATDGGTGAPLATIDATAVTARRTAAASGLSIDLLSRPDATSVAIVGAGVQGWAHLEAAMAVRSIARVRLWNRSPERAESFARRAANLPGVVEVVVCATPAEAAAATDIVCVCTNSPTAVLAADGVAPGTHVTAIGAFTPGTRELAADLIAAADHVVVDDHQAAAHEAGDILMAIEEGVVGADVVAADLADLVGGAVRITRQPGDITVYKSVGTSAMDAVAVRHILTALAESRLAVYGTLRPGEANASVLEPFGGTWQTGEIRGRRLADGWQGYPGVVLAGSVGPQQQIAATEEAIGPVNVSLLVDADLDWEIVDAFEGQGYRRRRAVVITGDGQPTVANIYVLSGHLDN